MKKALPPFKSIYEYVLIVVCSQPIFQLIRQLYMNLYHSITKQYLSVTNESSLEPLHVCLCSLVDQVRNT